VDTPATDPDVDAYGHAFFLHAALNEVRYNTIFVVVQFDTRFYKMRNSFVEQIKVVHELEQNVVILATFWDNAAGANKDEVISELQKDGREHQRVILLSKSSCPARISNAMYTVMSLMTPITVT
jgi:hypothetical protein